MEESMPESWVGRHVGISVLSDMGELIDPQKGFFRPSGYPEPLTCLAQSCVRARHPDRGPSRGYRRRTCQFLPLVIGGEYCASGRIRGRLPNIYPAL